METFIRKLSKTYGVKVCIAEKSLGLIEDGLDRDGICRTPSIEDVDQLQAYLEAFAAISGEVRSYVQRRKGKKVFTAYAALPRCSFVPYIVIPEGSKASTMKLVYLGTKTADDDEQTISLAIEQARRVTVRNVVKWTQQLLTTLQAIHKTYTAIGPFAIDEVILRSSDGNVVDGFLGLEDALSGKRRPPDDSNSVHSAHTAATSSSAKSKRPDDSNSVHSAHTAASSSSAKSKRRTDDNSSVHSAHTASSAGTAVDPTWEDFGRQAWLDLVSNTTICSYPDLKNYGNQMTCTIKFDMVAESMVPEIAYSYNAFIDRIHADLRCLGVIILQLILRRVFSSAEQRFWMHFSTASIFAEAYANLPPASPATSVPSTTPASPSKPVNVIDKVMHHLYHTTGGFDPMEMDNRLFKLMDDVEVCLAKQIEDLATWPDVLRRMLAICFLPRLPIKEDVNKVRHVLSYPLWSAYTRLVKDAKDVVLQYFEDSRYVKPSYWTEEDEQKRLRDNAHRAEALAAKATYGLAIAKKRITNAKYQVWWDMQSDGYRERMERQRKIRAEAEKRRREAKKLLKAALFHTWATADLQKWVHHAIASYCHVNCYFAAFAVHIRPKKAEVYVMRLVEDLFLLFDDFVAGKVYERYYDPKSRGMEKMLSAHPHLLHFNSMAGISVSRSTTTTSKSMTGSASIAGSASTKSSKKAASVSGMTMVASGSLLLTNSQTDSTVNLDKTISVEDILCRQGNGLVPDLPDRMVITMKICAFHLADQIAQHFNSIMLTQALLIALQAGDRVDALLASAKAVFLSPQQLHFKKLLQQSLHMSQHSQPLKQAVYGFYDEIKIIDRRRAKQMLVFIAAALCQQYVCEHAVRRQGEDIAAHIITAFFRMVHVRQTLIPLMRANMKGFRVHNYALKKKRKQGQQVDDLLQTMGKNASTAVGIKPKAKLAPLLALPPKMQEVVLLSVHSVQSATVMVNLAFQLPPLPVPIQPKEPLTLRESFQSAGAVITDDAISQLLGRAYIFGPADAECSSAAGKHAMVCIYVQTPVRAEVFDPFTLMTQKFMKRFSPQCVQLPCKVTALAPAEPEDEITRLPKHKKQPVADGKPLAWRLEVPGLLAYTSYDLIVELDADIIQHLTMRINTSTGKSQSTHMMEHMFSTWKLYKPPIFSTGSLVFQCPASFLTEGRRPSAPGAVHACSQYYSNMTAALKDELAPPPVKQLYGTTVSSAPQEVDYGLRYLLPKAGTDLGPLTDFSCLLQVKWPRNVDDQAAQTTYCVKRRLLLFVEKALQSIESEGQGGVPVIMGTAGEMVCAHQGSWVLVKDNLRGQRFQAPSSSAAAEEDEAAPIPLQKEDLLCCADYLSSLSTDLLPLVQSRCPALLRYFYASILSRPAVGDDEDLLSSGLHIAVQYKVQVTNSYGKGPASAFSLVQGITGERGFCEVAQLAVSRQRLMAIGKYPALPPQHPMLQQHFEIGFEEEDDYDELPADTAGLPMEGMEQTKEEPSTVVAFQQRVHTPPVGSPSRGNSAGGAGRPLSSGIPSRSSTAADGISRPRSRSSRPSSKASRISKEDESAAELRKWLGALTIQSPMIEKAVLGGLR